VTAASSATSTRFVPAARQMTGSSEPPSAGADEHQRLHDLGLLHSEPRGRRPRPCAVRIGEPVDLQPHAPPGGGVQDALDGRVQVALLGGHARVDGIKHVRESLALGERRSSRPARRSAPSNR